jgi:ATP-dependent exoDNAse (exonuclease V) alpha subunit
VLCTASSGIAALLLIGGRTTHSRCKIPIILHEDSICNISKNSLEADLFRATDLIIIDEITMQHRHAVEALDRTLQDILNSSKIFGGISVIFGGDWKQILPIVIKGSRPQIVGACLQRSRIWEELKVLKLNTNMRLMQGIQEENDFAKWQLEVGSGQHTDNDNNVNIPPKFQLPQNTVEALITHIYPGINLLPHPSDAYFAERSILSARNDDVHELNKRLLANFPGQEKIFHSVDTIKDTGNQDVMYPAEYLNSINLSGMPVAKLALKVGVPVMVLRNLNPQQGVCNGSRGIVTRFANRVIEIRLLTGDHAGKHVFIPRLKIEPSDAQLPFQFSRFQFALSLAFVMTINKAQGQSLKLAGLDFRTPPFAHGQFYVAVSRATSVNSLKIIWDPKLPSPTTKNIVYPEVLLD